jgi:hypothetical protein
MIATRPYIIYILPQGRTTQALIGGKIEKVWENVERFLSTCTNADRHSPYSIYLNGYTADEEHGEDPALADKILDKTRAIFGGGVTEPLAYHFPDNTPSKQRKITWEVDGKDLNKALAFMVAGQPYPKYNLGPMELIVSYDFKLVDPLTKAELPNQQFTSSLLLWLSKSKCVAPSLCFPFEEPDNRFWEYANSIEPFLPFKFDRKFLRLGRSNKKGTWNVFSKI